VRNASVEFDLETLSPTYRLTIGLPGRSNALAIASRLGLNQDIVASARAGLSPSELEVEDMLEGIRADRAAAAEARSVSESARQSAQARAEELEDRLAALEAERRDVINAARQQAEQELETFRGELRKLKRHAVTSEAIDAALERTGELEAATEELQPARPPAARAVEDLGAGDRVWVATLQREGEVIELGADEAEVQVGTFRARVPLQELEVRAEPGQPTRPRPAAASKPARPEVGLELDLRGQTVDEAAVNLDKYLDDAYLAHLPHAHIIHGKGTGALRRYVRETVTSHPLVENWRRGNRHEGGDGVTVVEFADR
jgi:DNA mismatch repair protein MutS2